jgi:S1-C subfamily serine protease
MKIISIILIITMTGCSHLASKTQQFNVTAIPEDADIVINGEQMGRGHAVAQVKRDSSVSVMVSRKGCQPMHRTVGHSINGLGILDGVGTLIFIVPAVGLAAAGSHSLDEDSIHFTLICEEVEKVKEVKVVEEIKEVEPIKKTSLNSGEAIVISTGSSKQVSSSPEEWTEAIVTVSAGMGDGSGFVISENRILTNHHVVGESKSVAIKFSNGVQLIGKVIASNSGRDVAIVKVETTLPKYFHLSKSMPTVGSDVYAVSTPLDEEVHSIVFSRGIISALRAVQNKVLIQSDVSIRSGSSGGPLIDKSGTVVGIAASKFSVNKTSQGISFFIPIDDALKSLEKI